MSKDQVAPFSAKARKERTLNQVRASIHLNTMMTEYLAQASAGIGHVTPGLEEALADMVMVGDHLREAEVSLCMALSLVADVVI